MISVQISWDAENGCWLIRALKDCRLMGEKWQAWSETGSCAYDKARVFTRALPAHTRIIWLHRLDASGKIVRNTRQLNALPVEV